MQTAKALGLCILLLAFIPVAGCVTCRVPISQRMPEVGLRCSDLPPQPLGVPVVVEVELRSLVNGKYSVPFDDCDSTFVLDLFRNGKPVAMTKLGKGYQNGARTLNEMGRRPSTVFDWVPDIDSLPPFGVVKHRIDISRTFEIAQPGEYTLIVRRNVNDQYGIFAGTSTQFTVVNGDTPTGK